MNKQRQEIYAFRNEVIHTDDMKPLPMNYWKASAAPLPRNFSKAVQWKAGGILKDIANG